jgi:hypothetical protein
MKDKIHALLSEALPRYGLQPHPSIIGYLAADLATGLEPEPVPEEVTDSGSSEPEDATRKRSRKPH